MRRLLLTCVLVIGALSGFVQGGTVAYFTNSASSSTNQFTAGTVDISNSPASSALSASGLLPGGKHTAPLSVTNSGTLALQYTLTSTLSNDTSGLGEQLNLTVKVKGGGAGVVSTCTTAQFDDTGQWGATLYGPAPLGSLSSNLTLISAPGRALTSSSPPEVLCFQVTVPTNLAAAFQNKTTTATFNFAAQQT